MGRFSPTVGPYTGPTVGDALRDGLERIFAERERRKEQERQHKRQDEQDRLAAAFGEADLYDRGVRRGTAPDEGDRNVYGPELKQPDDLASVLQKGMSVGGENEVAGSMFNQPLGMGQSPAPKPFAFNPLTKSFNPGPIAGVLPSRYQQMGADTYLDTTATPSARRAQELAGTREDARLGREEAHQDRLAEILARGQNPSSSGTPLADRMAFERLQQENRIALERERQKRSTLGGGGSRTGGTPTRAQLPAADERKAAALYAMAQDAAALVDQYEPNLAAKEASRIPVVGNIVGGKVDEATQIGQQAAYQLADAYMRFISGAAVPEQEVKRYMNTFTPQPGDTPATLERKRQARVVMVDALRRAGGRAMPHPDGPAQIGDTVTAPVPKGGTDDADRWAAEYLKRKRGKP